jgi:hypothetical protein
MPAATSGSRTSETTGARRWIEVVTAAAAVLVVLRATSGALAVLLIIIVLSLLLESHLNRRPRPVPRRR